MSFDYLRQVVSGKKARYVDRENSVDLDLVYVTDRIIIMGYPATGMAGLYRNRRQDVLKFINSRHGEKWWIWNLCPLYENAYSPESMHNRVSRYPFPDHHPPPLPLLPLAVREMTAWLEGDQERVAIIHCKAGKAGLSYPSWDEAKQMLTEQGRSGTLLCSYLLSLPSLPPPPQLDRSYSAHDPSRASLKTMKQREEGGWVVVGGGQDVEEVQVHTPTSGGGQGTHTPARSEKLNVDRVTSSTASSLTSASTSSLPSLNIEVTSDPPYDPIDIGDEGTYDEAGQRDRADGKVDEVFKLHSSRRMKPTSSGRGVSIPSQRRWCRYVNLLFSHRAPPAYVHLERPTRVKLVSITMVLQRPTGWQKPLAKLVVGRDAGQGNAWASVARYDDEYVDELRRRGGGGEGVSGEITWGGVGGKGEYDARKMFRSCGKMVAGQGVDVETPSEDGLVTHQLVPKSAPLILDRCREVRLKFHLASLPLGWAWFIPAFHLPEPLPSAEGGPRTHTLHFDKSQIDFALGPGASLRSVLVRLEEVPIDEVSEPARLLSDQEEKAEGVEDQGWEKVKEEGE